MDKPEHEIELVLRFRTNMDQSELDDFLCGASELLFIEADPSYSVYIPEGSHWRDVTYGPDEGGRYERHFDPPCSGLPGGNRLGPGHEPTPVPE